VDFFDRQHATDFFIHYIGDESMVIYPIDVKTESFEQDIILVDQFQPLPKAYMYVWKKMMDDVVLSNTRKSNTLHIQQQYDFLRQKINDLLSKELVFISQKKMSL
jgi:hypothetical protein